MRIVDWVVVIVAVVVFAFFYSTSRIEEEWADKSDRVSNTITRELADKLYNERELLLIGTGGGIRDTVHKLNLGFNYYHEVSLEEARELIVYVVSTCLSEINTHTEWSPYFSEYPVTAKTLDISIYVKKSDQTRFSLEAINGISAIEGAVEYKIILPGIAPIQTIHEETCQEALAIVCSLSKGPSEVECGASGQVGKRD